MRQDHAAVNEVDLDSSIRKPKDNSQLFNPDIFHEDRGLLLFDLADGFKLLKVRRDLVLHDGHGQLLLESFEQLVLLLNWLGKQIIVLYFEAFETRRVSSLLIRQQLGRRGKFNSYTCLRTLMVVERVTVENHCLQRVVEKRRFIRH